MSASSLRERRKVPNSLQAIRHPILIKKWNEFLEIARELNSETAVSIPWDLIPETVARVCRGKAFIEQILADQSDGILTIIEGQAHADV